LLKVIFAVHLRLWLTPFGSRLPVVMGGFGGCGWCDDLITADECVRVPVHYFRNFSPSRTRIAAGHSQLWP